MASASRGKGTKKTFTFKKRMEFDDDDDFKPSRSNTFPSTSFPSMKELKPTLSTVEDCKDKPRTIESDTSEELVEIDSKKMSQRSLSSSDQENLADEIQYVCQVSSSNNGEVKAVWKDLMGQMQKNQKEALQNCNAKISSKRGLKQSKAKGSASKHVIRSPSTKNPRLGDGNSKQASVKPVKLEHVEENEILISDDEEFILEAELLESSQSSGGLKQHSMTTGPTVSKTSVNVAPIFLPPAERKALQSAKSQKEKRDEIELPSSLVGAESEIGHVKKDNPHHFNGNAVILNLDQPLTDPYGGLKTKVCPFYKKLPGVPFCVDAFNYGLIPGMEVYFLSHYHSDHYIGLSKKFCKTVICSHPTGNLVRMKLYVEEKCIRKLSMDKPYIICDSEVTLIDANHCPGSVMFIFRLKTGQTILHTGDFRYTPDMLQNPHLACMRIDTLYLDTTYCSPQYDFPTQSESISVVISYIKRQLEYRPKTLVLCGSYLIGKERVYFTLAEALGSKVFGNYDKRKILNALENSKFSSLLASDENNAKVHVVPMFSISAKNLQEYLEKRPQFSNIIGIKPSGWQFSSAGTGCSVKSHYGGSVTVVGIPYSEHSSYSELRDFVINLKPKKVQATVNVGNPKKREEMTQHIENWLKT
ncbi:unnamed protein product [Orchesella dallaii]|uniref:DNA repair metallo-beta-lactamase domain-containing protein n=1 Tax=Orchesella dallaii TaxID=48710 RepID=A0ABP1PRN1_9HEXA